jgi:hypothetical protein
VVATETFLLGIFDGAITNCAFSRCGESRVYDWQEAQPLVLLGVVLGVRVLFLLGERTLLLRMITYYERIVMNHATSRTRKDSALTLPGDKLNGGGKVVHSSVDFRREARKILGGEHSGTIRVLIVCVLIQIILWFSDFKIVVAYDPSKQWNIE